MGSPGGARAARLGAIAAACAALGVLGCSSNHEPEVSYLLNMSQYAPTEASADERLMLMIGPDGAYEILHAPSAPLRGALPAAKLGELRERTSAAVAERITMAAEASFSACERSAAGYVIDIGDASGASRTGAICVVPSAASDGAKDDVGYFVALFDELTGRAPQDD